MIPRRTITFYPGMAGEIVRSLLGSEPEDPVRRFEENFARYVGVDHAVATCSGTDAMLLILDALGLKAGDHILTTVYTINPLIETLVAKGFVIELLDISTEDFNISLEDLKSKIRPDTKVVIVTHMFGTPARMEEIEDLLAESGAFLVEDAAHAHGSKFKGKHAGTFGQGGSFSFYPTKVITSGEGGIIITDDEKMYNEALIYRDQGKAGFLTNFHTRMGYNWRMSEIHAAIGNYQLQRLDQFIEERRRAAVRYDQQLSSLKNVQLQPIPADVFCNYYKYIAFLAPGIERDGVKKEIKEKFQVSLSGEVYDTPLHQQPVFEPYSQGSFPNSEDICSRMICLPIFATMSDAEVDHVVAALAEVVG